MKSDGDVKVELYWSRLLGFDQLKRSVTASPELRLKDPRLSKIGSKGCVPPPPV